MTIFHVFFHVRLFGKYVLTLLTFYGLSGLHLISQFIGSCENVLAFTAGEGMTGLLHMIIQIILGF